VKSTGFLTFWQVARPRGAEVWRSLSPSSAAIVAPWGCYGPCLRGLLRFWPYLTQHGANVATEKSSGITKDKLIALVGGRLLTIRTNENLTPLWKLWLLPLPSRKRVRALRFTVGRYLTVCEIFVAIRTIQYPSRNDYPLSDFLNTLGIALYARN
jgi:hypothetical protein